jgi:heme-degrading monooxygenase HmoA
MESPALTATPEPPYYAVIFVSIHSGDLVGYAEANQRMEELVAGQPGYLGMDSARSGSGVTVSYWTDEASIAAWRDHLEHAAVRERGRGQWYERYSVKVARVERAYEWSR